MISLVSLIVVRSRGVIIPAAAQQQHSEQWRVEEERQQTLTTIQIY